MISEIGNNALSNKFFYTALPSSQELQRTSKYASALVRRAPCLKEFLEQCHQATSDGFTLIEVLLSVAILAVGLVAVVGGYHTVLDAHKKANFVSEGYLILQQKIVEGRLEMLSEKGVSGGKSGSEGDWQWSTKITKTPLKDVYELDAEAVKKSGGRKLTAATYVRK